MPTLVVTKASLIGLKPTQQDRNLSWYWKPSQMLWASEVMDIEGESTNST